MEKEESEKPATITKQTALRTETEKFNDSAASRQYGKFPPISCCLAHNILSQSS